MKKLLKSLIPELSPIRLMYHRVKADIAALRYGFPARKLTVIGVTGTDGKTTTVGMIAHILNQSGIKTGALSTAFFQVGTDIRWNPTQKTSPSPFLIQKFLRELVSKGCTHAVIECSSHGLLQGRVKHIYPAIAGITNTSPEHLDYHGTMQKYREAKAILFFELAGRGTKVLNQTDETYEPYGKIPSKQTIVYGKEKSADLWLSDMSIGTAGSTAKLHHGTSDDVVPLELSIPGAFNLENALCAVGCAFAVEVKTAEAAAALTSFKGVPGRIERIDAGQDFSVYIDFTVTPKSYESTLSTLRSMLPSGQRLIVLTGSCGDRMKEKRPTVGRICADLADIVIVTNEDPYTEDPEAVIDDVLSGIPKDIPIFTEPSEKTQNLNKYCIRFSDRLTAIRYAIRTAKAGDIILFAGKGADITMMTSSGQVPWNEREIVGEEVRKVRK